MLLALPLSVAAAFLEKGLFVRAGMIPSGLHVVVGWLPVLAGLGAAIVTTQLAAFVSARRASRIRPTDALREATVQARPISWPRAVIGLAAFLGGIAVVLLAARNSGGLHESDAPAAAMLLMVAAALLGPLLAWPFAWLVGRPLAALQSAPGLLAWANTRSSLRRTASVATPLMLAISVVSSLYIAKSILHKETHAQTAKRTTAAFVLRAHQTKGLSTDVAVAARRLEGVAGASGTIATSVVVAADGKNLRPFPARTFDSGTAGRVLDLDVVSGSLAKVHGDGCSRQYPRAQTRLGLAQQATASTSGSETARPRLCASSRSTRARWASARSFSRGSWWRGHVTGATRRCRLRQRRSRCRLGRPCTNAAEAAGFRSEQWQVVSRSAYEADIDAAAEKQSLAVYVLLGLIVLFCALALVNALTMAIGERAREFALLRLIGATKRQVRAMIRTETVIMVGFGLTAGSLIAAPGLALLNRSLTGSLLPSVPLERSTWRCSPSTQRSDWPRRCSRRACRCARIRFPPPPTVSDSRRPNQHQALPSLWRAKVPPVADRGIVIRLTPPFFRPVRHMAVAPERSRPGQVTGSRAQREERESGIGLLGDCARWGVPRGARTEALDPLGHRVRRVCKRLGASSIVFALKNDVIGAELGEPFGVASLLLPGRSSRIFPRRRLLAWGSDGLTSRLGPR